MYGEENYLNFAQHIGTETKLEIPEETLTVAMARPYGAEIKLVIDFESCYFRDVLYDEDLHKERDVQYGYDEAFIREILLKYKKSTTGIAIPFFHNRYKYLLEESFYANDLEQIDLQLEECDNEDCRFDHLELTIKSFNSVIAKYAEKLRHLGICGMDVCSDNWSDIANIKNLTSLSLSNFICNGSIFVINKVNFERITKLTLCKVDLIEDIDSEDFIFKNLSDLSLVHVNPTLSVPLIKKNSKTLTKLKIGFNRCYIHENEIVNFNDIKFSKLRYLKIQEMYETAALSLMQNAIDTLEEICICDNLKENLESVVEFRLPHVKKINFKVNFYHFQSFLSSRLVYSLIYACNENTIFLLNDENICKPMIEYLRNKW